MRTKIGEKGSGTVCVLREKGYIGVILKSHLSKSLITAPEGCTFASLVCANCNKEIA